MRSLWCVVLGISAGLPVGADDGGPRVATKPAATQPAVTTSPHSKAIHRRDPRGEYSNPRDLLRVKWDAVLLVLQNEKLDQKAKEAQVEKIVMPIIDFQLMAKLALGRTHWRKLTPPQRAKFLELFVERLKSSYRERIARYTGERVVLKPSLPTRTAKDKPAARRAGARRTAPRGAAYIPIELVSKGTKVEILHKLRKVDKQWRMYDTEIEGVSILLTYRSQFNDILRGGTVEDLLSRLAGPQPR